MEAPEGTRFAQVRALFEAALDLDPEQRRSYVEREASDPGARNDALELLEEFERDSGELGVPDARSLARSLSADVRLPGPGARIAGYEVVRTIGEGGMGRVFEAREESPARRVALKMMRTGFGSAASQRRFEVEAEVLARLLHAGIAQVYASGLWHDADLPDATPRPWFAMEFVPDARNLPDYATSNELDIAARLRLFLQLCDAVEHAHQRGVIHRDLKAANVLVDGTGRVKVIDFGIARVEGADADSLHTREGEVLGTLATMSPEQALGHWDEVDVRTDVYALGVLLYELVSGAPPYDLTGLSLASAVRVVCEDPPARPGGRGRTRGHLPGADGDDLSWIALRALEKERARRYANVAELAADVRRFLAHEPVLAGPPTLRYRARKFLRRHRLPVAAGLLVFASLVAGLVFASIERTRAVAAAEASRRDADHAAFISAFLLNTLAAPDPWVSGPEVRVRDRIDSAVETIHADLGDRPQLQASLLAALGRTYAGLSLDRRALEVLEEAVSLLGQLHGARDLRTLEARADRAGALLGLARYEQAEDAARTLEADARAELGAGHELVAAARADRILALCGLGQMDSALEEGRALVSDCDEAFGADHPESVGARRTLAAVHSERGEVREAERLARACLESLERSHAPDHPDVLRASRALAAQLVSQRNYEEAASLLELGLERSLQRFGEEHTSTIAILVDLTALHLHRRDLEQATASGKRAVRLATNRLATEHPLRLRALEVRADVLILAGEHGRAEELFLEILPVRRRELPAVHSLRAESESAYATLLHERGRWAEAEEGYRRAIAASPAESRFVALSARHGLGVCLLSQGESEEAAEQLELCLAGRLELSGPHNDEVLDTRAALVTVYQERGELDRARGLAEQVAEGRLAVHGPDALKTAEARNNLAVIQQYQGEYRAAEATTREVLAVFRAQLGETHPATVRAWNNLGLALHYQGRRTEALDAYLQGLDRGLEGLGEAHPAVTRVNLNLAELQMQMGQPEEALILFEEVMRVESERGSPGSLTARYAMSGRGRALEDLGRTEEADTQAAQTLQVLREHLGAQHWETLRAALEVARTRRARGALQEAAEIVREAARIAREHLPAASDLHPHLELEAGELCLELGNLSAAREHLARARDAGLQASPAEPQVVERAERGLERISAASSAAE